DLEGTDDDVVLHLAALNAGLQRARRNPIDEAILTVTGQPGGEALDEVPYDFVRKRLSILTTIDERPMLVTKGAFDNVVSVCDRPRQGDRDVPLRDVRATVDNLFETL